MLKQRAGEAAALLTNQINQSQSLTRALAAVVLATNGDAEAFRGAASRDPAIAGGTAVLLKDLDGRYQVIAVAGGDLATGQELNGAAGDAVRRAQATEQFVSTGVFAGAGGERRLGQAWRIEAAEYTNTAVSPASSARSVIRPAPTMALMPAAFRSLIWARASSSVA